MINGAQLHLALNHVPVILAIVAAGVLFWGYVSKSYEIRKVGLVLAIATAVFAGAAFLTGDPAEDVLEKLPVFSKELVHEHEEAGEFALIVSIVAGVSALVTLYFAKKKVQYFSFGLMATLLILIFSSAAFLRTAHLGGLIRHEEIR